MRVATINASSMMMMMVHSVQPPNPEKPSRDASAAEGKSSYPKPLCLPKVSAQLVSLNSDKGSDEKWHLKELVSPGSARQFQGFRKGDAEGPLGE